MLLLPLIGCGPDPAPPEPVEPDEPPIDPAPWTFVSTGDEAPGFEPETLGRVVEAAAAQVLTYDAEPVIDAYTALFEGSSDATCPTVTLDPSGNRYWVDGCTADDGTFFGGYLSDVRFTDTVDAEAGLVYNGTQLAGNVALIGPEGAFDLEGSALWIDGVSLDGAVELVVSALVGGFYLQGDPSWLGEPASVNVTLTGYSVPAYGGVATQADGSVPVVVDGDRYDVWFHAVSVGDAGVGSLCEEEPGGMLEIRDPWGRWVEVTFHGPVIGVDGGDPSRCDGCGDALFDGQEIGSVCAGFDPWFQWEKLP